MFKQLVESFITLLVVLDPIGSVPIFLIATVGLSPSDRRRVAFGGVLVAFAVLMIFLWCAQYIFVQMHISVEAFRIAGGIVLFVFALQMILSGHHQSGTREQTRTVFEISVFPVAMPSIAGPGALLAVVLLTDYTRFTISEQIVTAGLTVVVLGTVLLALLLAEKIQHYLGTVGIMVITQVMGLILAAFAVQQILDGLVDKFAHIAH